MPHGCDRKRRFPSAELAAAAVDRLRWDASEHAVKARALRAYYCRFHNCWHIGHHSPFAIVTVDSSTLVARAVLHQLMLERIDDYGRTKDRRIWDGVRLLKGAYNRLRG